MAARIAPPTEPRFLIELCVLVSVGHWGFEIGQRAVRWLLGLGAPILAAVFARRRSHADLARAPDPRLGVIAPLVVDGRIVTMDEERPMVEDGALYVGSDELIHAVQARGDPPPGGSSRLGG